jgi:tetratricopeptide (TPR) repeat protein
MFGSKEKKESFARYRAVLALTTLAIAAVSCRPTRVQDPAEQVRAGWQWYSQGDFDLAMKEFSGVLANAPANSHLCLQARYGLATTWDLRRPGEDVDRAATLYREVIAAAPTNDLAAWSSLALVRMKARTSPANESGQKALMDAYQEVIDRFPSHMATEEAFLLQQAARLEKPRAAENRAVLEALENFLQTHPWSPNRSTIYALIANCREILGLRERIAEAVFQQWKTSEIDPLNPVQDLSWTYWRIATVAEFETGDFATARDYYRRLIEEYPTEQRVFLARQELRRMDELEASLRQAAAKEEGP